jgi:hypothetical protein
MENVTQYITGIFSAKIVVLLNAHWLVFMYKRVVVVLKLNILLVAYSENVVDSCFGE